MAVKQTPQLAPDQQQASTRARKFGSAAGLLFIGLVAGVILGTGWALFRPGYTGTLDEGVFAADPALNSNVEFTSYIWFVVLSGVLGAGVAIVAYISAGAVEGVGTLLWVGLVAAAGSFALLVVGHWLTAVIHPIPNSGNEESLTLVPPVNPRIGWAAAPFMAVLTYWIFAVISLPEELRRDNSRKFGHRG